MSDLEVISYFFETVARNLLHGSDKTVEKRHYTCTAILFVCVDVKNSSSFQTKFNWPCLYYHQA